MAAPGASSLPIGRHERIRVKKRTHVPSTSTRTKHAWRVSLDRYYLLLPLARICPKDISSELLTGFYLSFLNL